MTLGGLASVKWDIRQHETTKLCRRLQINTYFTSAPLPYSSFVPSIMSCIHITVPRYL